MREVSLRLLETGACRHPEIMTIVSGSLRPKRFPALAMLLIHPVEGPILFDTGYDPAFVLATNPFPERLYRWLTPPDLTTGQDAASQLARLGIGALDIRHLVLSHFHADHMSGTVRFPAATIHCARAGHRQACAGRLRALRQGILPALAPPDFAFRCRYFEDGRRISLPRDMTPFLDGVDLLGDGSLNAVELPGHCPGHWGLMIKDAASGLHFLVADAAWSSDAIRRNTPPPHITGTFLGDAERGRTTLASLHALWRRNPDITLTPSHCAERAATCQTS